ncbi:hypothetical protein HED50_12685 [Ochrobactrum oryzae]|nr:hypothetical protein [Brucella oryzae]
MEIGAGTLQLSAAFNSGRAITLSDAASTIDNAHDNTLSGVVSGTGKLTKTGAGVLTLSGQNTYAGGTAITAGTLSVGADNNLCSGRRVEIGAGTLQLSAAFNSGRAITLSDAASTIANTHDNTLSGIVSGTGKLTKTGAGVLTLSGQNTYAGGTAITAGTLSVGADNNLAQRQAGWRLAQVHCS